MIWFKRGLTLIALAVVVYLFWPLLGELRAAADLFRAARWGWLVVAMFIQSLSYASLTWLNALTLQPFAGRIGFARLAALLTSMAFIEVAIPSAGASGVALRARLLGKHGYTVEASTFTLLLETILLAVPVASVALLGLGYLLRTGELTGAGTAGFALVALGVAGLVWGGWRLILDKQRSRRLVGKLATLWNRWAGRFHRVDSQHLESRLAAFQSGLAKLQTVPFWKFCLAAYGRVILDIATLGVCFLLLGDPIATGTLLTGYGMTLLLGGLAALPGGLGMADASLPVVFHRLGVPGSIALAASLTYRLIAFWLLRLIGFISWQILESRS